MGRRANESNRFTTNSAVYSAIVKPELVQKIQTYIRQDRFWLDFEKSELVKNKIQSLVNRILKSAETAKTVKEVLNNLKKINSELDQLNDLIRNTEPCQKLKYTIEYLLTFLERFHARESGVDKWAREFPVSDADSLIWSLDDITNTISSKSERLDFYRSIIKGIANASNLNVLELKAHRGRKISFMKPIDTKMFLLILKERIKQEKIRLLVNVTGINNKVGIEAARTRLRKWLESFESYGLSFYPLESFLQSEFIIAKSDIKRPLMPYRILMTQDVTPPIFVWLLMSLQGNLFKEKDIRDLSISNFLDCKKQEFKHWLLSLDVYWLNEPLVDRLLDKPLRFSDKKIVKKIILGLNNANKS